MPPRFSAIIRRMPSIGALIRRKPVIGAVAVVAVLALTAGILASTLGGPQLHFKAAPAPSSEKVPGPAFAAQQLLDEADLTGEFSFVLYDRVEDRYLLSHDADEVHFSMSISKILIAVGALQRGADASEVAQMLSWSDDPIANGLWGVVEGPAVIEEQVEAMGLEYTEPSPEWGRWGDTWISASDMVRVYEYVLTELPESDRTVIIDALIATTEKGSDGYDQTFGIPDAAGDLDWAVKQGWGCCKPDRFLVSTGTIGSDHRYIAAIFGAFDETRIDEARSAEEMTTVAAGLIAAIPDQA